MFSCKKINSIATSCLVCQHNFLNAFYISFYLLLPLLFPGTKKVHFFFILQKQPPRGVLSKRCSENIRQIYRRTPYQSVISKQLVIAKQLYWNQPSAWVLFSCKFAAHFQNTIFLRTPLGDCFWFYHSIKNHLWVIASDFTGHCLISASYFRPYMLMSKILFWRRYCKCALCHVLN